MTNLLTCIREQLVHGHIHTKNNLLINALQDFMGLGNFKTPQEAVDYVSGLQDANRLRAVLEPDKAETFFIDNQRFLTIWPREINFTRNQFKGVERQVASFQFEYKVYPRAEKKD